MLVEDRREVLAELRVDELDDVFGQDVLVAEVLEEVVNEVEPARVIVYDVAEGVQEERPSKCIILQASVDATLRTIGSVCTLLFVALT